MPLRRIEVAAFVFVGRAEMLVLDRDEKCRYEVAMASEQIERGDQYFAAEDSLSESDKIVARFVLSVGASPLKA